VKGENSGEGNRDINDQKYDFKASTSIHILPMIDATTQSGFCILLPPFVTSVLFKNAMTTKKFFPVFTSKNFLCLSDSAKLRLTCRIVFSSRWATSYEHLIILVNHETIKTKKTNFKHVCTCLCPVYSMHRVRSVCSQWLT
jgi:hypothetical protein